MIYLFNLKKKLCDFFLSSTCNFFKTPQICLQNLIIFTIVISLHSTTATLRAWLSGRVWQGDEEKEHKPLVKEMHEGVRVRDFKGWEGKMLEL